MSIYILPRTGSAALKIDGEPIANAATDHLGNGGKFARWYEVALYRSGERLAWSIGFRGLLETEADHDWSGMADTEADLVAAIEEPRFPPRVGYHAGAAYAVKQAALMKDLLRHYQQAVSAALTDAGITLDPADAKTDPGRATGADVSDHAFILAWAADEIAALKLTRDEACAICAANNGSLLEEHAQFSIAPNVFDAARLNDHDEKWDIDAKDLFSRIQESPNGVKYALAWACAQFWRRSKLPTGRALAASGFIHTFTGEE